MSGSCENSQKGGENSQKKDERAPIFISFNREEEGLFQLREGVGLLGGTVVFSVQHKCATSKRPGELIGTRKPPRKRPDYLETR